MQHAQIFGVLGGGEVGTGPLIRCTVAGSGSVMDGGLDVDGMERQAGGCAGSLGTKNIESRSAS